MQTLSHQQEKGDQPIEPLGLSELWNLFNTCFSSAYCLQYHTHISDVALPITLLNSVDLVGVVQKVGQ
jgi:hypothetical protein